MSSLREIKDHIGSVKSTLKITSAMKLVASSKLRKAQNAIESMRPYEEALGYALSAAKSTAHPVDVKRTEPEEDEKVSVGKTAVVTISSNSSLCGGFNSNVIKKTLTEICKAGDTVIFALGRKVADAVKKAGVPSEGDFSDMVAHPSYGAVSALADELSRRFISGEFSSVILVYTHFISTSRQEVVAERYLPFEALETEMTYPEDYIVEPSPEEAVEYLTPLVLGLKLYAAVLDSAASEHSARTIAMQTATDNGNDLLSELTLEYNKGRQQKITAEILDLIGGKCD